MTDPKYHRQHEQDAVTRSFQWLEKAIYTSLGSLLALAAIALLLYSIADFLMAIGLVDFPANIVTLLDRLLLVLLVVELLYTVQLSYSSGTLVLEPFLFVGLIAAIRRIFVLTAEFTEGKSATDIPFDHFVTELGALSGLILVLAISIWLLRRSVA